MKIQSLISIMAICLAHTAVAGAQTPPAAEHSSRYLQVSVDNLVIHTEGIIGASRSLAQSIDGLSFAIERIATSSDTLSVEERAALVGAVKSVESASDAVTRLADELPQTAQRLSEQLPQMISDARAPIAELSSGLEAARQGIVTITESLPEASASARQLVNDTLDAALYRLSIYTAILLAAIALVIIALMWFVYSQYLRPLAQKLDALTGAPEHLENMTLHMRETSSNLLRISRRGPRIPRAQ